LTDFVKIERSGMVRYSRILNFLSAPLNCSSLLGSSVIAWRALPIAATALRQIRSHEHHTHSCPSEIALSRRDEVISEEQLG
jgi:hypothetical protein